MAKMLVKAVADLIGEHDTRLLRMVISTSIGHWPVRTSRGSLASRSMSFRLGQEMCRSSAEVDQAGVVFTTHGRDAGAYGLSAPALAAHGGAGGQVIQDWQDMSESYLTGALEHPLAADITFDRYNIKPQRVERDSDGYRNRG